ncbi:MAG: sensor histidine kinase, partial [Ignavibacteriales bacterium]|nr:sensor histidine kinase [Ignavibacteriales bacterium]
METASNNAVSSSSNVKVFLLTLAFVIVGGTLWYTHEIVLELQAKQKNIADLYAKSFEYLGNGKTQDGDYSFVLENIIRNIDFPIISTDANHEPVPPYSKNVRNVDLDTALSLEQQRLFLKRLIIDIDELNTPIKVQYGSAILNYVHFGESKLIKNLRLLPYVELSMVALFILIAYISFSYVKRNEQSSIWVGMARETAHQLGTPISSMMGWIELLKHQSGDSNPHITETLRDMDND